MATGININTNYSGKYLAELLSKSLLGSTFLSEPSNYTLHAGVKHKLEVNKLDLSNLLKPAESFCGFTPDGEIEFGKVVLEPKKYTAQFELCYTDYYPTYQSELMRNGANENEIPFSNYLVNLASEGIAEDVEDILFNGAEGTDGGLLESFEGIIALMQASTVTSDAAVVVDESTSFSLDTPENVLTAIELVYKAIPKTIFRKNPRPRIYVSESTYRLFQLGMAKQMNVSSGQNLSPNGDYTEFMGIQVRPVGQFPDDKIVAFAANNLHIGTDLLGDWSDIRVKNMDESDLSGKIRYQLRATLDVKIGYYSETVLGLFDSI
jgi:hypothetical protein